jgi:hypothetical protein
LSNAAQAHGEHAEALLLMRRVLPAFAPTDGDGSMDVAEILISQGESQMELRLLDEVRK